MPTTTQRPSWAPWLLWTAAIACAIVVALLAAIVGLVVHFRVTPTFDDYLRDHAVAAEQFDLPVGAVELGEGGTWRAGEVDPFALVEDDAEHRRSQVRFSLDVRHGDELLLGLVQEMAVAIDRDSWARVGASVRTVRLETAEGVRAQASIFLDDPERFLEAGQGRAIVQVILASGTGPDRAVVAEAPSGSLEPVVGDDDGVTAFVSDCLRRIWPMGELPPEGLIHRVQTSVWLIWRQLESGAQGAGFGDVVHEVNSSEYSYSIAAKLEDTGDGGHYSRETKKHSQFTWNGKVW